MDYSPHSHGVSWSAVIGGAVVTASLCLMLIALGAGVGLSAVSPWSGLGASATAVATGTILWIIVTQILAGSFGGYLAGRLRRGWPGIHDDEVYFRDTAHGFLAWGLAFVITAAFLATAATVLAGGAAAGGTGPAIATASTHAEDANLYYTDILLRPAPAADAATATPTVGTVIPFDASATRAEVNRIFAKSLMQREVTAADRAYLASLISARTGLSAADADRRISAVLATAEETADGVRKAAAHSLLWMFVALLIGAFSASVAATIGGRQRDLVVLV